jgi:hypothetical protein
LLIHTPPPLGAKAGKNNRQNFCPEQMSRPVQSLQTSGNIVADRGFSDEMVD